MTVPQNLAAGEYDLELAILDLDLKMPKVKLAIAGVTADGWYPLGKIRLR